MSVELILWPVVAMVCITFVVWIALYVQRLSEMSRSRISPESLVSREAVMVLLKDTRAADNFRNLCEFPVLFYVASLSAFVTSAVDQTLLILAWGFVGFRALHSLVHCSYNRVAHRFVFYFLSTCLLWAMWAKLAAEWLA